MLLRAALVGVMAFAALAVGGSARAQPVLNGCIQDTYDAYDGGGSLNCTANDVAIVDILSLTVDPSDDGCAFVGDTVTFDAQFLVQVNAQQRQDVGFYIATDGGDALMGTCYADTLSLGDPGVVDLDGTGDDTSNNNTFGYCSPDAGVSLSSPTQPCNENSDCALVTETCEEFGPGIQDICGDMDQANAGTCSLTRSGCAIDPDCPGGETCELGTAVTSVDDITVLCVDDDGDGMADLKYSASWRIQGNNELCLSPLAAFPGNASKCKAGVPNSSIAIASQTVSVTKELVPASDPGLFDLAIDAVVEQADASDGDGTGPVAVLPGVRTVSEAGGTGTALGDYASDISCIETVGRCTLNPSIACLSDPVCDDASAGDTCDLTPTAVASCTSCTSLAVPVPSVQSAIACTVTNTNNCAGVDCSGLDDACNAGQCNPSTGLCEAIPVSDGTACDDATVCNGAETCQAGTCQAGPPPACDDNDACNGVETCDAVLGCQAGAPLVCDNADVCDGTETCDSVLGCQAGTPLVCDNADVCDGTETCDSVLGCQAGTPLVCDNADVCDGTETCDSVLGCQAGTPLACDNADVCDGTETCDTVLGCQAGTPLVCDNADVCDGTETCDSVLGCQAGTPLACDNADVCDGTETCDTVLGCQAGTPLVCDNADACDGAETCDSVLGCQAGSPLVCDNANVCDGAETCDTVLGCQAGTPLICSNGDVCDGTETCDAVLGCQAGTPLVCDNADVCDGAETCDAVLGCQAGTPLACDNGDFCDGAEGCDAIAGCQPGTPPSCDDAVACTSDLCDELNDVCTNTPDDLLCDDAVACTVDTCAAIIGCQNAADDAFCDDGEFCDGAEVCNPATGCQPGFAIVCPDDGVSCTEEFCDEIADQCEVDNLCQCGNGSLEPGEQCDPPSGLEDCNNFLDDDGDGDIDCADLDCADPGNPNVGIDTCGNDCAVDLACQKILRDPAKLIFGRNGRLDRFKIHGRILQQASIDLSTAGLTIMLSNANGVILQEQLSPGQMVSRGSWYRFRDRDARFNGGFFIAKVKPRTIKGIDYLHFSVMMFGDHAAATLPTMTTQIAIGGHTATLTRDWTATSRGWKLSDNDF